ncbi:MAG TPA: SDR family NAD(P)-dependent oxidoreductase [Thermoleophilia bacterium]|nr:SDR family NAD(P)-dependent oxidoreductase [Thermoleophilia bacterium]
MKDFKDKVLFVTGGASGAGFGQAKVFSEAGCKVVIADIRQDHLDNAMAYFREKNAPAHAIRLDITDRAAYAAAADEVEQVFGSPPQLLFNTAGVNTFGPPEASTYEDYDWVMGVCLGGVINGMVTFVPRMIKAGKGGYIITTASMGGFWGGAMTAPYSAAKAAVINLMESYRLSLAKYSIGVSVLCPAAINSNIHNAGDTRPKHLENTGYLMDDKAISTLKTIYEAGMDPVALAKWVKKGIEAEQLYILPYPEEREALERHFKQIVDSVLPEEADPEGVRKRREVMKALMESATEEAKKDPTKPPNIGFGKANPDLDWVKPVQMR